ncbi:MAG: superoxide dismutase, Ni [Candidatus Woykebacteria bacterium]
MIKVLLRAIDKISTPKTIYAHCDIPCGIYDPHLAQVAAHTVIRMTALINELPDEDSKDREHKLARYTLVKEEHAELVKKEVRVIWGDYFKPEHLERYPKLHSLVFEIMKLSSKVRQEINPEASEQLLAKVQDFTEIFWETKGVKPTKAPSNYPSGGEIVLPTKG